MVCGNEEELGVYIYRVAGPRQDVDADMMVLECTQMFTLGECHKQ